MKRIFLLPLLALAAAPALAADEASTGPVAAAGGMGIAAIVGSEAISSYDVENRIRFIIATAKLSDTPDVIERIRPQVLRSLIDEKLQLEEAKANDITVTEEELEGAIKEIEQQRNMAPGTIADLLAQRHVPRETFTQQIRAQLLWHKLLMKKVRPNVHVSDEEIKLAGKKALEPQPEKHAGGPQELKIAVITLPVDKPSREKEVKSLGDKLVKEMRGGASFEEVSRQFSSVAASAGGKVESFWVNPEQLDPAITAALASPVPGAITEPVRSSEGYTIVKIYDTRSLGGEEKPKEAPRPKDVQLSLKQILLKLKQDAENKEADTLLQIGEEVAKHPGTCDEKGVAGIENTDAADIQVTFSTQLMSELPAAVKLIVQDLKVGEISTPFASYQGIVLYMVCGRNETDAKPLDRERVYGMLIQQKMELEAQKYMRNLRRETFIEVR